MKIRTLIKRGGGVTAVASSLGISSHAVAQWQQRNRIPVKYWASISSLCASNKAQLTRIHLAEFKKKVS